MKVVRGDLIALAVAGGFDVIVHGCNCFCAMGAGIAKAVKATFPAAYEADLATPKGDRAKLGTISIATIEQATGPLVVVNAYTQHHWKGKKPLCDEAAIRAAFREVARRFASARIGYPRIGAGLAGGDWARISAIIEAELAGLDHTLVEYDPKV